MLTPKLINPLYKIPATTLFLGQNLIYLPECHSTNTVAQQLCQNSMPPEGTVVITSAQTAGKGQRGNTWITEPGQNLTFSTLFYPTFLAPTLQFGLTMAVAVAVAEFLKEAGFNPQIKWPNDVLVNSRKISGLLLENSLQGEKMSRSIAGIGLNVNQTTFSLTTATSMALETGHSFDLNHVFHGVVSKLEVWYLRLRERGRPGIEPVYLQYLYGLNQSLSFETGTGPFMGTIIGIDASGKLVIRTATEDRSFSLQEIRYAYKV